MTPITPEMKQAIVQAGDAPARFVDPESKTDYVLVRADFYDRVRGFLAPLAEGWDDPSMDAYDEREHGKAVHEG